MHIFIDFMCSTSTAVPPPNHELNLILMWSYLEVGPLGSDLVMIVESLWIRLVALLQRPQRALLSFMPGEDPGKMAACELGSKQALTNTAAASTFTLVFSVSRTVRNNSLLSTIQLMVFCHGSHKELRQAFS